MTSQVVKVRRETILACMTCPLCKKLLKEATTISLCLHTFCRKCIYEKLSDEEMDTCPVCDVDLGCIPEEKLRPDHNLQDVRAKIFPSKRRKIKAPEVTPSISLPIKRKERSLSSLVVSTPKVSIPTGLTGKRTKSVARKSATLRGSSFGIEEPEKKEEDPMEYCPGSSSSPETLNKIVQHKRQISPSETFQDQRHVKNKGDEAEAWKGHVDLWKPLNCLVEVANRTKSLKISSRGSSPTKSEPLSAPDSEVHMSKPKLKEQSKKLKVQEKNGPTLVPGPVKRKRLRGVNRKSAAGGLCTMAQAMLDATWAKQSSRRNCPVWFSLVASEDEEGNVALPQISACYLRIKDDNLPVSFIQKYIVKKLDLTSEAEVEIRCQGEPVVPTLQLRNLVDLWVQTTTSTSKRRVQASVGTSAKDFVMVLSYSRTRLLQQGPGPGPGPIP